MYQTNARLVRIIFLRTSLIFNATSRPTGTVVLVFGGLGSKLHKMFLFFSKLQPLTYQVVRIFRTFIEIPTKRKFTCRSRQRARGPAKRSSDVDHSLQILLLGGALLKSPSNRRKSSLCLVLLHPCWRRPPGWSARGHGMLSVRRSRREQG